MALYEDPELENGNEEGTSDPSFGGRPIRGLVGTLIDIAEQEARHEARNTFFDFVSSFFGGDDE